MSINFFNECSENRIEPDELKETLKREHPKKRRYHGLCNCYKKYLELLERR